MSSDAYRDVEVVSLEKCPFCGDEAVLVPAISVICRACGATGPHGKTPVESARLWNERPVKHTTIRDGHPSPDLP